MYQDLSEKEKNKKRQYGCKFYKNLPEDESKGCFSTEKIYYKTWIYKTASQIKTYWYFLFWLETLYKIFPSQICKIILEILVLGKY